MDQIPVHAKIKVIQQIALTIAGLRPDARPTRFKVLRLNLWNKFLQCLKSHAAPPTAGKRQAVVRIPCGN